MDSKLIKTLSILLLFAGFTARVNGEDVTKGGKQLPSNVNSIPSSSRMNINMISTWFYNNGISDINSRQNSGFVYPKGTNKTTFYQSGLIWGGKVDGSVRVGGATYKSGVIPGSVINGKAEDPADSNVHIYRVRRDFKTGGMNSEMNDGEGTFDQIYARYKSVWMNWPAGDGAPYEDVNGDGKYDPAVDIPGVKGADQTIWYVNNDFNSDTVKALYGSESLGLECQTTVWGYNQAAPVGNTIFRKHKLVNKGQNNITDMYVSMWSDPDLGDANDDLAGCDTTLNLAYIYNGSQTDVVYGTNPPAAGFDLFQGPVVAAPGETAIFDGHKVTGKKNLPMAAFYYLISGVYDYDGAILGDYKNGTLYFYNQLQGKLGGSGEYFPIPPSLGGGKTRFPLSGDPVKGTGYLDGIVFPKGDRRFGTSSGPFNMAPGDVQEVVFGQIAAGGPGTGMSNLDAITTLKSYAKKAQEIYNNLFSLSSVESENIPFIYDLSQNYPNPFNPVTTISYSLPERSQVELKVYDILGREIMTLVNKEQNAGKYNVQFDAGRLSSGIYVYRISAKNFTRTNKMVLLK
jgi:hypothetical protein